MEAAGEQGELHLGNIKITSMNHRRQKKTDCGQIKYKFL